MKRAFTLIEVIISIGLFFLILLFLYRALDVTKSTNLAFEKKVNEIETLNDIKTIFIEDIAQASTFSFSDDEHENIIFRLQTDNMFHNPFNGYVTYIVSRKNRLLRIESRDEFDEIDMKDEFFKHSYIDILLENVKVFEATALKESKRKISIMIQMKDQSHILFSALQLKESND